LAYLSKNSAKKFETTFRLWGAGPPGPPTPLAYSYFKQN